MKTKLLLAAMLLGGGSDFAGFESMLVNSDVSFEQILDILQTIGEISVKIFHIIDS